MHVFSEARYEILLTPEPLSLEAVLRQVSTPGAGGICFFVGTVRNETQGKEVIRLEFEAYAPMAVSEMQKIAVQALEQWPLLYIGMHHRTGLLSIGELPVIIGVSAAHREAAFAACQFCIDTLKKTVPIWKKEIFRDGEVWVAAHP